MGETLDEYKPFNSCPCCAGTCSEEMATHIAKAYISIFRAHGDKPFRLASRFSGSLRYFVSRMWPEKEETAATEAKPKPFWNPACSNSWMALFYKWGRMH